MCFAQNTQQENMFLFEIIAICTCGFKKLRIIECSFAKLSVVFNFAKRYLVVLYRSTESVQKKEANDDYEEIQPYSLGTNQTTLYANQ